MVDAMMSSKLKSIIAYSICSASMLMVNKVCLIYIPASAFVSLIQVLFATLFIMAAGLTQIIKKGELMHMVVYVLSFAFGIFCNMQSLKESNIETIIIFRSASPVIVTFCDTIFLGRAAPNLRSVAALGLICLGSICYVLTDAAFKANGIFAYGWAMMYLLNISFQMTYGKMLTSHFKHDLSTTVFYTNVMSVPLFSVLALNEIQRVQAVDWSGPATPMLIFSCVTGLGISYAGWYCRAELSATSYTIVGFLNKIATILVNVLIWDKHASAAGTISLFICLCGGVLYEQAPMKKQREVNPDIENDKV